eukprot:TRINITY_DN6432_c1_g3_i1.p1 TRINITY_DN6432_c1_g3~~TRINITY_DN6432_c1_g3_i1.p1  ORF type:complete len:355 (+),score=104.12 TRINITY_DN6432_c1_g3_i1:97-1161(+)
MFRRCAVRLCSRSVAGIDVCSLAAEVVSGNRRAVSRGITYVESVKPEHRHAADELLQEVSRLTEKNRSSLGAFRVAVSGPPGAGKSCFIEELGTYLTNQGHRVAVLTIDPSSTISGGSLLGDKTRMDKLSFNKDAFVRPSPTRGCLGGVTEATYDALLLCEGAGFDVCIVETVGVGQSEVEARNMTDCFMLLLPPAGGDELQGIKKGIVEVADMVVITKSDGATEALAKKTASEYRKALQVIRPYQAMADWKPPVLRISSHTHKGIHELWETVKEHREHEKVKLLRKREEHRLSKLWECLRKEVIGRIETDMDVAEHVHKLEDGVGKGTTVPRLAARHIVDAWVSVIKGEKPTQ